MATSTMFLYLEKQKEKKGLKPNKSKLLKTQVDKGGRPGFECKKARCGKLFHSKRVFMIHIKNHERVKQKGESESDTEVEEVNVNLSANNLTCAKGPTKPVLRSKRCTGVHRCNQPSCEKVFPIPSQLKRHILTHKAPLERPNYVCDLCESNRIYLTAHGFKRHMRIHHSENGPNQCRFCLKLCESEEMLVEHIRKSGHNEEKQFLCVICNQRFSLRRTLQRHLKTKSHIAKQTLYNNAAKDASKLKDLVASFPCKKCESTFATVKDLKKHLNSVHNSEAKERTFICPVEGCNKACLVKKSLSIHIKEVHEQVRKLKCEKCGQKFKRMTHLRIHMNTKWSCGRARGDVEPGRKTKCVGRQSNKLQKSSEPRTATTRISGRIRNKGKQA